MLIPLIGAGCAGIAAAAVRHRGRGGVSPDPPDQHFAVEAMEAVATGEGMPEAAEDTGA